MSQWTLGDDTGKGRGYLRLLRDGVRVVDAFPFARDADEQWVREQAARVVEVMNGYERVTEERDQLAEQLATHEPSAVEREMQEVMRINNELGAALKAVVESGANSHRSGDKHDDVTIARSAYELARAPLSR